MIWPPGKLMTGGGGYTLQVPGGFVHLDIIERKGFCQRGFCSAPRFKQTLFLRFVRYLNLVFLTEAPGAFDAFLLCILQMQCQSSLFDYNVEV